MAQIRIKNFGPIKKGYQELDGFLDIKKVTVFIGNQGSGKSTVAKLISTFTWIEKAYIRGDIKNLISYIDLIEYLEYHRLEDYLEDTSELEYYGNFCYVFLKRNDTNAKPHLEISKTTNKGESIPKIMYVPAERNFLSAIENINKVSDLITGSLKSYSIEYRNAQIFNKGKEMDLPINNTKVVYDPKDDETYLLFGEKRLKLSDASSGFHSIVPLHWVTKYLDSFIRQSEKKLLELLSTDQFVRRNKELYELKGQKAFELNEKALKIKENELNKKYICKYLVNIVEEPEQNLFPTSQKSILESLLAFNNMGDENKLILTTHSPFLINYLTLCLKAESVYQKLREKSYKAEDPEVLKINNIVPLVSTVKSNDLVIYELDEWDGSIKKLGNYEGIPSDNNFLNKSIRDGNLLFDSLLEIEEEL